MASLWEGIQLGLALSLLIGPLFFALVQAGITYGLRAGLLLGLGIWSSDVLFIAGTYGGIALLEGWVNHPAFVPLAGGLGSLMLLAFGAAALLAAPGNLQYGTALAGFRDASRGRLWTEGFLLNTINPFTFFFWIGLSGSLMLKGQSLGNDPRLLLAGIFGTIICTDSLKVLLAKSIRRYLQPLHLLWFRRASGAALIIFGIILLWRAFYGPQP